MANRLYNKQVTPKGYKMGGRTGKMGGGMMMKRPMMKKGGSFMSASSTDKRKISGRGGGADSGKAGEARSKAGVQEVRIKKGIKNVGKKIKDIVTLKSFHKAAEKAYKKSLAEGKTNRGTAEDTKNMRVKKKMGGSLKPVNPQTQKGLSKLPTQVRNKMGYMNKGGKVEDKPGKNMVLGETFHPITENAMVNNIVKRFNSGNKEFASVNDLQDRHKEIKEKFFTKGVKPSEIQKLDKEFKSRLVKARSRANKAIANRPGMKEYRKKQQKAKAIDTGSEN